MKRVNFVSVFAAASVFFSAGISQAQNIKLTAAERGRIKNYVAKQKIPSAPIDGPVTVGATLSNDVLLRPQPQDWAAKLSRYAYVVHNRDVIFVDRETRRITAIVR